MEAGCSFRQLSMVRRSYRCLPDERSPFVRRFLTPLATAAMRRLRRQADLELLPQVQQLADQRLHVPQIRWPIAVRW